ncbi:SPOR domain-containing protein [Pleurocapsales cyanobacterium LEGE 06147]|nr:SPOR domain-containing protein [Pleurocapsales cyanobacterium LEGE 06147]
MNYRDRYFLSKIIFSNNQWISGLVGMLILLVPSDSKAEVTPIVAQTTQQQKIIYANAPDAALSSNETLPPPKPLSPPPSPSSPESTRDAIAPENAPTTSSPIRRLQAEPQTNNSIGELIFTAPATESSTLQPNNTRIDNFTSNLNPIRYHVIVEASDRERQARVRSLYPDAFSTVYRGNPMLQVGVFSNREKAENVLQSLEDLGIKGVIVE